MAALAAATAGEAGKVLVLYASQKGTARGLADRLAQKWAMSPPPGPGPGQEEVDCAITVRGMQQYDPEDLASASHVVIFAATYEDGKPPENCKFFCDWLEAAGEDFRVDRDSLRKVKFAVFGLGDSAYGSSRFNLVGKALMASLRKLGAVPVLGLGLGDASGDIDAQFELWAGKLRDRIFANAMDERAQYDYLEEEEEEDEEENEGEEEEGVVDVEDIGKVFTASKAAAADGEEEEEDEDGNVAMDKRKEMVTAKVRESLTKQGYKVIGSHSGVKLCRWTKAMLRGRGGCYKHTFYGIQSYSCMELTPSLACANKCVFCWRHHTNPVGKKWKWKMDQPKMILDAAIEQHRGMIKQMKGVPGVVPERYEDAFTVKHCALSLVGEPIMYPEINTFVNMLHEQGISSFLVTNAQFPEALVNMVPVTQLYVSIDAGNKESLKAVDRPLHSDFWERYMASLDAIRAKAQRTVFRITLVKGYNMAELAGYASLVRRGEPDLIEVKGVTFCGKSDASDLSMKSVPFHQEVVAFCRALAEQVGTDYDVACEHEHSCCVLMAKGSYKVDGRWMTWIDYPRFNALVRSGEDFAACDYWAPTPEWAMFGDKNKGFDPEETRCFRKGRGEKKELPPEMQEQLELRREVEREQQVAREQQRQQQEALA